MYSETQSCSPPTSLTPSNSRKVHKKTTSLLTQSATCTLKDYNTPTQPTMTPTSTVAQTMSTPGQDKLKPIELPSTSTVAQTMSPPGQDKLKSRELPESTVTVAQIMTTPGQDKLKLPESTDTVIVIDSENLPHTSAQETPPTNVSVLGNRKRKLVLSAKQQSTKKTRKSCSSVAGKTSVAKGTCSKCMPSLLNYFKPQ